MAGLYCGTGTFLPGEVVDRPEGYGVLLMTLTYIVKSLGLQSQSVVESVVSPQG
jgi:hypothetical protein